MDLEQAPLLLPAPPHQIGPEADDGCWQGIAALAHPRPNGIASPLPSNRIHRWLPRRTAHCALAHWRAPTPGRAPLTPEPAALLLLEPANSKSRGCHNRPLIAHGALHIPDRVQPHVR